MSFQHPYLLILIAPVVIGAVVLFSYSAKKRKELLSRIVAERLREQLVNSVDYRKRRLRQIIFTLALVFLIIAIARPIGGMREIKVERPGVDVVLCLDISRSMSAEDAVTNRLNAAQRAINRLLNTPCNHRYGLVAFAGEAFLIAPITIDHGSVARSASALNVTSISKPGTDISAAIKKAVEIFDPKKKSGKAIILITDGEQLQGDAIMAAREASANGINIFTVSVGTTAGAKLPDRTRGRLTFAKNEFGIDVVSRINEYVLRQVAAAGRGYYVPLGNDGEGLFDIAQRGLSAIPADVQIRKSKDRKEYFQFPLAASICLFLVEILINERRKNGNNP